MAGCQGRHWAIYIVAAAVIFGGWALRGAIADEPDVLELIQAKEPQAKQDAPAKDGKDGKEGAANAKFDPAVVSAGMAAFERSCTSCHDAARSLERTKDLAGWRATVRRMAAKRGADIAAGDVEPISVYLTSRNSSSAGASADKDGKTPTTPAAGDTASISTFATLSPLWRAGNDRLQNPGFGPLAWVGASWQSKIVSARVTVCVACHGVQEQAFLSRVDIVEAAVRVDLTEFIGPCVRGLKGGIDAGRLIVPFGAYSSQVNPGTYRTVSTPLIFNMGQRVYNQDLGDVVLPMPYSDTGVNLNLDLPLTNLGSGPITASMDTYLINGLWGGANGIDFLQSRNLWDNNNRPAGGGRLTVGDPYIRAGTSFMYGRLDNTNDTGVPNGPLNYRIYGFDIQARYKKLFRCQIEYARRDTDRSAFLNNELAVVSEKVDGYYLEAEVRPWEECKVSLLGRHDFLRHTSPLPLAVGALPSGEFNVERITVGVNIELWHQSLLMLNYERWIVPEPLRPTNVYGIRYTITF